MSPSLGPPRVHDDTCGEYLPAQCPIFYYIIHSSSDVSFYKAVYLVVDIILLTSNYEFRHSAVVSY